MLMNQLKYSHTQFGHKVSFNQALRILKSGGIVAIPTETVYGLAADISNFKAIKQIFHIKKRPFFDPLIVHFSSKKQLNMLCKYDSPIIEKLSDFFHPGPLTLVLKKTSMVTPLITAGSNKVAVRMPDHPSTLKLLKESNMCLAAPSANLFSKTSPTRAYHVLETLKVPVLDGGPCSVGIESSVVEVLPEKKVLSILRPGVIGIEKLQDFLKKNKIQNWKVNHKQSHSSPGQEKNHYQPDIPFLIIESKNEPPMDALPSYSLRNSYKKTSYSQSATNHFSSHLKNIEEKIKTIYPDCIPQELKMSSKPHIFARELYHSLRQLSKKPQSVGYVIKPSASSYQNEEAWQAIWDRLEKASCQTLMV